MTSYCDGPLTCAQPYDHCHCCRCGIVLLALAEGPVYADDRPVVDAFEDSIGARASVCSACKDDAYILCQACAPYCDACRAEHAA